MTRIANQLTVFYEKNIVFTQVILKFKGQILPCDFQNTNHFLILHVSKTRHDNLSYLYHNIFYQIHPSGKHSKNVIHQQIQFYLFWLAPNPKLSFSVKTFILMKFLFF